MAENNEVPLQLLMLFLSPPPLFLFDRFLHASIRNPEDQAATQTAAEYKQSLIFRAFVFFNLNSARCPLLQMFCQATFEKMGGDSKGVAKKKDAIEYYNQVIVEGGLEEVAMMIDELGGDTITFEQFCGLFTKWTIADDDMEKLLAKVKYVAKQK
eukprot:jgi/Bigna1/76313/fgenesh1_pg.40_\